MRRLILLLVCGLAVTFGGLFAASEADARRWGRSYYSAPRAYYGGGYYRGGGYYSPRSYYYSSPRSYYGRSYYGPSYYGRSYYGGGYGGYYAPRAGLYIGF
jgi:hypothetical protein